YLCVRQKCVRVWSECVCEACAHLCGACERSRVCVCMRARLCLCRIRCYKCYFMESSTIGGKIGRSVLTNECTTPASFRPLRSQA
ncbi:hypothetical protein L9F63_024168, partial [Diploptera punctata]